MFVFSYSRSCDELASNPMYGAPWVNTTGTTGGYIQAESIEYQAGARKNEKGPRCFVFGLENFHPHPPRTRNEAIFTSLPLAD